MTSATPTATIDTSRAFSPGDWAVFASIAGIWGSSFLLIAIGLDSLEPGLVTLMWVGFGAAALWLLPGERIRVHRGDWPRLVAVSIIWVGVPFTLFPLAEERINSAVTGLLNGATPMFTALMAVLFFGRRTSGPQLLGVFVGFAGVVLISLPSLGEGSSQALGVAMVLLATFCYGIATNLVAPLQAKYGSRPVMARMLALATIWTAPYGVIGLSGSRFEWGPVIAVSVLGLVGTGLAFLLMGSLVGRVGPTRSTFITYLIPVVALLLGVTFQDDHVAVPALIGVVLVVSGAILASRQEAPRISRSPRSGEAPAAATT